MRAQIYYFLLLITLASCTKKQVSEKPKDDEPEEPEIYTDWLIDINAVEAGCERLDCIRSLDEPEFIPVQEVDFLTDEDLVIGVRMGNTVHCYPHAILDWHEIINDHIGENYLAINYCPLTGSGMAWNRLVDGEVTTFGISGLLFNSNVIPYDRSTRSAWSQMKQLCVNGKMASQKPETFQVVETSWSTWKKLYPESKVVSTNTGMQRDYLSYPYGDYRENKEVYFDVVPENDSLHPKERLYGIVQGDSAKCYRVQNFKNGLQLIQDFVFGKHVIIAGSARDQLAAAFEIPAGMELHPYTKQTPGIMQDAEGNIYDIFGYCVSGKDAGKRLEAMNGFTAYWFAWYAFYPTLTFQ